MEWIDIEKTDDGLFNSELNKELYNGDKDVEFMGMNQNTFYASIKNGKIFMDSNDAPEKSAIIKWRLKN